jgi:two-component system cell cycle response regulator
MPGLPLILLVEDVPTVREPLERQGYRVAAIGGADAVATAGRHAPDAVLLEHEPPRIDGMALLTQLRADDALAAVPVILLTHEANPVLVVDALRAGAQDCLVAPFDPAELEARLAAALRTKRLHDALLEANERLARQALTDDLTGLANRRQGVHTLERTVATAVRHGRALALVRVDVDGFKGINDTHGHQGGDQVLAEVARRLAHAARGGDEVARWGGDEFVAILPDTDREGAFHAAQRLREAVSATPVAVGATEVAITISIGWAHWSGDTPDDLLARADRSLYQAKDAGRDTVRPEFR